LMFRRFFDSVTVEFLMRSGSYRAALRQFPSSRHYPVPEASLPSQDMDLQEHRQTEDLRRLQMALEPERVTILA
jgi:hypothetical protein